MAGQPAGPDDATESHCSFCRWRSWFGSPTDKSSTAGSPKSTARRFCHYLRGDYDDAIDALESLRGRVPDYLPTYFCLAEACVRGGRFEKALEVASWLASDYPDVAHNMESDIWLFKRIHQRRGLTA